MDGYDETTYGEAFADVYDEWYEGISGIDATVGTLLELAGADAILELGVGTGRLAIPLALAGRPIGVTVTGVDASAAMLTRLSDRDADTLVRAIEGDMIADLPDGPFSLAFVAYNTIFNLTAPGDQAACFLAVASRLGSGGRFVVEAFVPDEPFRTGDDVSIRSMTAERLVLSATRHDAREQRAEGQFVEITEAAGIRLRPWSIRYSTIAQLDEMAAHAGLALERRWASFAREPFTDRSQRHVSVYRKN